MFSGLPILAAPVVRRQPPETIARLHERSLAHQAGVQHARARAALVLSLTKATALTQDFTGLRQLRAVIRTYGLSKPLMVLANPGLRRSITNLPGLESLDLVGADGDDPRTRDTIAGLDTTLDAETGLVADWVRCGADNIDSLLTATADQVQGLGDAVGHYIEVLDDVDDSDALSSSTLEVVPFDRTTACIRALLDVLPGIDAAVADPTDRDAMDTHKAKLAGLVEVLGEHTGLSIDVTNPHQLQLDDPVTGSVVDTFASHGYTADNVGDLLEKAEALLAALQDLLARKDTILAQFEAAAAAVAAVDNDVPPAVDDAIIADGDGDEALSNGRGMTQADVIHSHVSSHMCCLAAVTDAAVRSVQNALCVAQHVDTTATPPTPAPVVPAPTPAPAAPPPAAT
jgi:hypothetical protein